MTITKQDDRSFQVQLHNRTENFTLLGDTLISASYDAPIICGSILLSTTVRNLLRGLRNGEQITLNA